MKSFFACFALALLFVDTSYAQKASATDSVKTWTDSVVNSLTASYNKKIKDSLEKVVKDSLHWATLKATAIYPLIKRSEWSGAFPVENVQEKPDPTLKYKLLFNVTVWPRDSSTKKEINGGLAEVGRIINLHVASGVPKENIEVAIVIHGGALNVYLNNEAYRRKFKVDNPNLDLLKQFTDIRGRLMACGQAELFFKIPQQDMIPEVKTAFTAQTVLSTYQLKGYVLYNINDEEK